MKVFSVDDMDGGRPCIIVADDITKACELFKKAYTTYPERVRDISAEDHTIIIQGIQEPEFKFH
jgi:hypothetical protein